MTAQQARDRLLAALPPGRPARAIPLLAIAAGLFVAVIMLLLPVRAEFSEDEVLRLSSFDRQRSILPTEVDCGSAPANMLEPKGGSTFYDIARDAACHRVGHRRFWLAIAAGATLVSGGLVGFVAAGQQE